MGLAADGQLVTVEPDRVRYRFRLVGGEWLGTFDIPLPLTERAEVVDTDHPMTARAVATKAVRSYRQAGEWPDRVAFRS